MKTGDDVLTWQIEEVKTEWGSRHLLIHVGSGTIESVEEKIRQTIEHPDQWSRPEVVPKIRAWNEFLLDRGHAYVVDPASSYRAVFPGFTVKYQLYNPGYDFPGGMKGYCSASVDIRGGSSGYDDVQKLAAFLKKIAAKIVRIEQKESRRDYTKDPRNWVLDDPVWLVEALQKMKAVRVHPFRGSDYDRVWDYQSEWVLDNRPVPWFRTNTWFRTFGVNRY